MNRSFLLAALLVFACFACSTTAKDSGARGYTLVFLKTGPQSGKLSKEDNQAAFAGHFANMGRLAQEHKLVLAGPFGGTRHDNMLRGLFVLNSSKREEASAWASTDPTTQAGVFVLEYRDFSTDAPLEKMVERVLAMEKQATAEGRSTNPGDGARPYVLLIAEPSTVTRRELLPLTNGKGVFLIATLEGGRTLALLDAKNVAEAKILFAKMLRSLGPYTLDDWFATDQLTHLNELAAR